MTHATATTPPDFRERYGVLLDIGRILTGTLEPDDLYRCIYEQASRVLETTGFFISLYDAEQDLATVVFSADRGVIDWPGTTYEGSRSRAIRERVPLLEELEGLEEAVMLLGPESDEEVTRSVLAAPMLLDSRLLGVISAQSYRIGAYDISDLELLSAIARLAAVAVSNARTMESVERQRRESQRLEQIGRALSSSLDMDRVLRRIVAASRELADADGGGVWLLRSDRRAELVMTEGETALPRRTITEVPEALRRAFEQDRRPVVIQRDTQPEELPAPLLAMLGTASAMAVPLIADDELIGALSVSHREARRYADADIRLLQRFAFHAAAAVANARLHDQLRTLSLTDPLTGLPNRRHMDMFLAKEFAAAERGRSLTVVMFDLNDFKAYNDSAGHQAGDDVLRRFAEIIAAETRAMNLAARYGGDEFICILSDTDAAGAELQVGRVLETVEHDERMGPVSVTAGMASYHPGMRSPEDLVRKADQALYRAKAQRPQRGDPR